MIEVGEHEGVRIDIRINNLLIHHVTLDTHSLRPPSRVKLICNAQITISNIGIETKLNRFIEIEACCTYGLRLSIGLNHSSRVGHIQIRFSLNFWIINVYCQQHLSVKCRSNIGNVFNNATIG